MTISRPSRHIVALAALVCAAACSSPGSATEPARAAAPTAAAGPQTVEQLAKEAGCKPKIQVDSESMRQGFCKNNLGQFFITTFSTQKGKDEWMDQAPEYNPHLVGPLWTILAERAVLDKVRARVGGDLHLKDHRCKLMACPMKPATDLDPAAIETSGASDSSGAADSSGADDSAGSGY
ncbi:hypothetical protein J5X84_25170 [Streptosporangiaceae bacterium NEAU-GS5]|nr:hypothetical protein [Streptosporangiaceae bacterium NEAU-GS5]